MQKNSKIELRKENALQIIANFIAAFFSKSQIISTFFAPAYFKMTLKNVLVVCFQVLNLDLRHFWQIFLFYFQSYLHTRQWFPQQKLKIKSKQARRAGVSKEEKTQN